MGMTESDEHVRVMEGSDFFSCYTRKLWLLRWDLKRVCVRIWMEYVIRFKKTSVYIKIICNICANHTKLIKDTHRTTKNSSYRYFLIFFPLQFSNFRVKVEREEYEKTKLKKH